MDINNEMNEMRPAIEMDKYSICIWQPFPADDGLYSGGKRKRKRKNKEKCNNNFYHFLNHSSYRSYLELVR